MENVNKYVRSCTGDITDSEPEGFGIANVF